MKSFIGATDNDWFAFLSHPPWIDEVDFWQPGGRSQFRSLQPGEPFLFKLHKPYERYIAGGGFFAHHTTLPISLAWQTFGEKNGAPSYLNMRRFIGKVVRSTFDSYAYHRLDRAVSHPELAFSIFRFLDYNASWQTY